MQEVLPYWQFEMEIASQIQSNDAVSTHLIDFICSLWNAKNEL